MTPAKSISNFIVLKTSQKLDAITNIVLFNEFFENWHLFSITTDDEMCVGVVLKDYWDDVN